MHERNEVLQLADRILLHKRPLTSPTYRDVVAMADGDRVFDGVGGYVRYTYYPGKSDEFFQKVVEEVNRRYTKASSGT